MSKLAFVLMISLVSQPVAAELSVERFRAVANQWVLEMAVLPILDCAKRKAAQGRFDVQMNRLGQVRVQVNGSRELKACANLIARPTREYAKVVEVSLGGDYEVDAGPPPFIADYFVPRDPVPPGHACMNESECGLGQMCFGTDGGSCIDVRYFLVSQ